MNIDDIKYLSINTANMSLLPVRIYKNNEYQFFYYSNKFIKDPVTLVIDSILNKDNDIGYITTVDFFYYAYIKYENYIIIYGPFRLIKPDDNVISKMVLELDINKDDINDFISSIKSINPISLESVIPSLLNLNFILNNEKLNIKDILVGEGTNESINQDINDDYNDLGLDNSYINNSLSIEKELSKIVENGEIDELKEWLKNAPAIKPGILSKDSIRQTKNTFIAAVTLISRSAIKGDMNPKEALALSDLYIQKMELLENSYDIYSLEMNMAIDYTLRVSKIHNKKNISDFLIKLNKYILSHLSDAIKSSDICKELYISKSSLFDKVKKETGYSLSNYILYFKINEAKKLLENKDISISFISIYLGFSSQSHFNHAFKKFSGSTPLKYRNTI